MSRRAVELGLVTLFGIACQTELVSTAAAAGFGLVLIVFYRWDEPIARIRQLDGLRACGRRSYSVYLIHLPVCTVGNAALAAAGVSGFWPRAMIMIPIVTAASVAAGWAFYSLVDRRFTSLPTLRKPMPAIASASDVSAVVSAVEEPSMGVPSWSS
jgi:peptidoglycan/LPS O-acetylase OafA/YrhL